jgi:type IV pilus assembly protein PilE
MRKGFRKAFTLVEIMIVIAIIAILAGVAIPTFVAKIRKAEAVEAVGLLKHLVDAQSTYKSSHGEFYIGSDFNKTLRVLNVGLPSGKFNYNIQANTNKDTILIRAYNNEDGTVTTATAPFIYMFFPKTGSVNITPTYNKDEWENTVYNLDYVANDDTDTDVKLSGGTWVE